MKEFALRLTANHQGRAINFAFTMEVTNEPHEDWVDLSEFLDQEVGNPDTKALHLAIGSIIMTTLKQKSAELYE